ncbi:MAG TPA: purine-nucleoside phosphorylase [Gemmatimonadales bacterium]|nr:purine-nucleoside phosphorylase [Gemmatimonadales bacterium]
MREEETLRSAADAVESRLGGFRPRVAIVLGSGLGFLADAVEDAVRIPYREIPGFPEPGVAGHKGELVAGRLEGVPVIAQSGRFHLYEGHPAEVAARPVRVFAALGARTLILTNAAGGLRSTFRPGTLMLIADHINLTGRNPLIGPVVDGDERFPDMSGPYDAGLRRLAREAALAHQVPLEEGVYCALLGPSYETPAEIRMLHRLGADAVGMSTVPEVIAARARGLACLGFSTITNAAAGMGPPLSHAEVLVVGRQVADQLAAVIRGVLTRLSA